jgi:hypothetical protein
VVKAALGVWLDPLRAWAVAAFVVGSVVAIAAGATVRRLPVGTALTRIAARAVRSPRSRLGRAARAAAVLAVGTALVASPRRVLTAALVAVGALLLLAALADLLGVAAGPAEEKKPASRRRGPACRGGRRRDRRGRCVRGGALVG